MLRVLTILSAAAVSAVPIAVDAEVVATRMLNDTIDVDSDAPHVVVRNIIGSIRVTAHAAKTIEMAATETIRGDLQSDVERARAEIGLRTDRDESGVAFRVRRLDDECSCAAGCCRNGWDGYTVEYEIELRVPRGASLDLSTVNKGEIVVEGVHGDFAVANVNGAVRLDGLRGSGTAKTVNGPLEAVFERAPQGATAFKTVNGKIEVGFPRDLSADLSFKTLRGEIWTDFEAEPIATAGARERTENGDKLVFRSERRSVVRVGSGGPTHLFETLNGDIYVRKAR